MVDTRCGRTSCTHTACAFDILCVSFCYVLEVRCMRFYFRVFLIDVSLNWSYRILECSDQKGLSLQAVQALLNKCLPCIPVNDVEDKLFQYVLPYTRQLFNEVISSFTLLNYLNMYKITMRWYLHMVLFVTLPLLMMFNFWAKNCVTISHINHFLYNTQSMYYYHKQLTSWKHTM